MSTTMSTTEAPDFFVIGTAKAGTTSLHDLLEAHPGICLSDPKETWYFDGPNYSESDTASYLARHFAHKKPGQLLGEVATSYMFAPFVAARLKSATPNAKLIVMLRDPIERAFSDWWMMYSRGFDHMSFDEAIENNLKRLETGPDFSDPKDWAIHLQAIQSEGRMLHRTYLDYGVYGPQIGRYRALFPEANILILQFERFKTDPDEILSNIYRFLNLPEPAMQKLDAAASTPKNMALPSRRIGMLISLLHRSRLSSFVPSFAKDQAKKWLSKRSSNASISPETRARLNQFYADKLGDLDTIKTLDLTLWPSIESSFDSSNTSTKYGEKRTEQF